MASFTTRSVAPASPADTFRYITDVAHWPAFPGFGPVPAITRASLTEGTEMALGSRVRVENSDHSVHHERVMVFEPGRLLELRMEVGRPASWVMARIEERVELAPLGNGTGITRSFVMVPASFLTAPLVWCLTHWFLRQAVERHNARVAEALKVGGG